MGNNVGSGIHILGTGRALPEGILTNDDLSRMVDTSDEWIRTRTGIGQRHICGDETCVSLALEAARKAIGKAFSNEAALDEIGVVLVATTTGDYAFPSVACMVKEGLGLSEDVMAFDISAACAGFIYGLEVVRSLLVTGRKRYALIIGGEQMSRVTDFTDRSTCVLFGDGAGAAVVELSDGIYCHRAWSRGDDKVLYCPGVHNSDGVKSVIHMEGNQVFKFAVTVIGQGIDAVLEGTGLTMDDIDYVVCHQANERIIDHVRKKYKTDEAKFYKNIERYGNTSAASVPIALDEMHEKGLLKPGMRIICVGFGAGLVWSSVLFTV